MIVTQIAAASENNVIGRQGDLPWHISEDLKFFRSTTKDHIIIMGGKTFDSVGKAFPKRFNIIVTRNADLKIDGAVVVTSIDDALKEAAKHTDHWGNEVFVCGGGEIYKQAMPKTDKIYLTRVHTEIDDGDAFFPEVDLEQFEQVESRAVEADPSYTFLTYQRKSDS